MKMTNEEVQILFPKLLKAIEEVQNIDKEQTMELIDLSSRLKNLESYVRITKEMKRFLDKATASKDMPFTSCFLNKQMTLKQAREETIQIIDDRLEKIVNDVETLKAHKKRQDEKNNIDVTELVKRAFIIILGTVGFIILVKLGLR